MTNGAAFIAVNAFDFSPFHNYMLAVCTGITYIAAAAGAGPILQRLRPFVSERTILMLVMVGLGLCTAIPSLPAAKGSKWPIWMMTLFYTPLTGVLWPMVESYISGGRSGPELRKTLSRWNVVWSSAVAFAMCISAPLIESRASAVLLGLGCLHVLSIGFLFVFPRNVPRHLDEDHVPVPATYADLLTTFRILLPASYIVISAISPYLPGAFRRLDVPLAWHTVLASAWLFPRVIAFWLHDHTQKWRGHWWHPILGGLLILAGFGIAVFSPRLGPGVFGVGAMIAGLAALGSGMACIYSGAIYYVMSVHASEVKAGGSHESLVGVGYTIGPLFGLLATVGMQRSMISERAFEPVVMGLVAVVAIVAVVIVIVRVRRQHRV